MDASSSNCCQNEMSESVRNTKLTGRKYHGLKQILLLATVVVRTVQCAILFLVSRTLSYSHAEQRSVGWCCHTETRHIIEKHNTNERQERKKKKNDQSLPEASYSYYYYPIRVEDDDNTTNDQYNGMVLETSYPGADVATSRAGDTTNDEDNAISDASETPTCQQRH